MNLLFNVLQLFDWSKIDGSSKDRLLTFYRLADRIADKLKGLFVLFAGQLVKPFSDLLQQLNISHSGSLHISICLYEVLSKPDGSPLNHANIFWHDQIMLRRDLESNILDFMYIIILQQLIIIHLSLHYFKMM